MDRTRPGWWALVIEPDGARSERQAHVRLVAVGMLRGALIGAVAAVAVFLMFGLANLASLGRDLPQARDHVRAAFTAGSLQDQDWLAGNTDIGHHQFNDCLILWQAIDQRASVTELAVSPLRHVPVEPRSLCNSLRGFANGEAMPVGEFYHRYLHGHTILIRYLLPHLTVEQIRMAYHTLSTLLVLAGLALSLWGLARGRRPVESLFWTIVFLAFARWFGLESFGQSLGHGPSDIVHLGFLLFLAAAAQGRGLSRRTAIVSAAVFGSLVAVFEFLTGGIPLGLAAIIGGMPFALNAAERDRPFAVVTAAAAAFCTAVLTCLLLKVLVTLYVFGPESITGTASQMKVRLGLALASGETAGVDIDVRFVAKRLLKGLGGLASGMHLMAGATILLAIAAGAWGARRLIATGDQPDRDRAVALLASNAAIALLLGLLWQHTLIHAWFMERTLAWTIATGFALFALALRGAAGAGPARTTRRTAHG